MCIICLENVCKPVKNTYNEGAKYEFESHADQDWKLDNKASGETWAGAVNGCLGNQVREGEIEQTSPRKVGR